jgi:hypothetical protein
MATPRWRFSILQFTTSDLAALCPICPEHPLKSSQNLLKVGALWQFTHSKGIPVRSSLSSILCFYSLHSNRLVRFFLGRSSCQEEQLPNHAPPLPSPPLPKTNQNLSKAVGVHFKAFSGHEPTFLQNCLAYVFVTYSPDANLCDGILESA